MINLSEVAANEIKRIQRSRQQPQSYFRIGVRTGGCSGLLYTFELSETPQADDVSCEVQGISIVVDPHSYAYLQELTLDYSEDLMGGGFQMRGPANLAALR